MCVSSARAATGGPTPANIKTKPIKPHRSGIKVAVKRQLSLRPQLRMEEWESRGHGGDPAFCPKCPLTSRQWETPCFPRVERQRASVSAPFAGAAATVVPSRGTDCTTAWYCLYHAVVVCRGCGFIGKAIAFRYHVCVVWNELGLAVSRADGPLLVSPAWFFGWKVRVGYYSERAVAAGGSRNIDVSLTLNMT